MLKFLATLVVALGIFVWAENNMLQSFQGCIIQEAAQQRAGDGNQKRQFIGVIIKAQAICSLRLIDAHNGFFAAFAAYIIAWFTLTLWGATDNLWKLNKKALETTERAFVFIDGFNYELTTAADLKMRLEDVLERLPQDAIHEPRLVVTRFAIQPRWKNGGNTPTNKMMANVNWQKPPGPIPPDYIYKNPAEPLFVAPKAVEASDVIEMPGALQPLIAYGFNPIGAAPLVLVWGRADYEDAFGHPHFVEWCYRLRAEAHKGEELRVSFIQWGDHNRTDETRGS